MESRQPFSGAVTLHRLVGRTSILNRIRACVSPMGPQVFYLKGQGGIGKTRLLQEIMRLAPEWFAPQNLVVLKLVDVYHYVTHSEEGLARAIYGAFPDEFKRFFGSYDEKQKEAQRLHQGGDHERAAEVSSQVLETFTRCLQYVTKHYPLLMAFDTLEILGRSESAGEVLEWLTSLLGSLEGQALVLLAGRPDLQEERHLVDRLGERLQVLDVGVLSPAEVYEYLTSLEEELERQRAQRRLERLKAIPQEMRETIAILSEGRPIMLALITDLILGAAQMPELFHESPQTLYALDKSEFAQRQRRAQVEVLNHLRTLRSPQQETLELLSLTRKGMPAELLARLQNITLFDAMNRLEEMSNLSFIKVHTDDRVYLHDEMYDLLEESAPNPEGRVKQIGAIADWYEAKILQVRAELQDALKNKFTAVVPDLRQQIMDLQVEKLYYLLQKQVVEGMTHFIRMSLDAHFSSDLSWHTQIESEARESLGRKSGAVVSQALEWEVKLARVRSYILQRNLEQAKASLHDLEAWPSPGPLHTAHSDIWQGVLDYKSGYYRQAEQAFRRAMDNLSGSGMSEDDPWKARLQALLYLQEGYVSRVQGKNQMAVEAYRRAIALLRWLDDREALVDVLKNQAFARAELGEAVEAQTLIEDALELAKGLGVSYMEALCLNTQAMVAVRAGKLDNALQPAQQALALFGDLGSEYGKGLACTTLAEAYRRLALAHRGDLIIQRKEIGQSQRWGEEAVQILGRMSSERAYQIQAHIEVGSAYRDMVLIEQEAGASVIWINPELLNKGRHYLETAAELARESLPYRAVEAHVNLALLELYLGDFEKCNTWLELAEKFVPPEYIIREGCPYPPSGEERSFWLALGKLYQVRANALRIQQGQSLSLETLEQIGEWTTLAMAYNELFYPTSFGAQRERNDVYRILKKQPMAILQELYRIVWRTAHKYGLPCSRRDPKQRTMAIQFLEDSFGPSDIYLKETDLQMYGEE